jgi:hypothetical protein
MKNFPNSICNQLWCILLMRKFLWSNSNLNFSKTPNLVTSVQIHWNFLWDVPVSTQSTCLSVQNVLNCLPQTPHMISRALDKFHDLQTLFEFYTILNPFYLTISIMHREPNVKNLASFRVHGLRVVSWKWISFFQQLYSTTSCTCSSYRTYKKIPIKK